MSLIARTSIEGWDHPMGSRVIYSKNARKRGQARKRRRKRAERRAATAEVREAVNAKRRAEGHPGWAKGYIPWWRRDN